MFNHQFEKEGCDVIEPRDVSINLLGLSIPQLSQFEPYMSKS